MSMTKILFFSGIPIDDAATLHRSGLVAKKITSKGYQVVFTSVSGNFRGKEVKKISGLEVLFLGQAHYWAKKPFSTRKRLALGRVLLENFKTCFRVAKVLQKEKPDRVLVITSMPISLMVGLVAKILGFKTLIDIEDLVVGQMETAGYSKPLVFIYGILEKIWLKIFNKVAVCSHYLTKRYPDSILLPNMVDLKLWKKGKQKDKKRIVFMGQMGPYHGQLEVLSTLVPVLKKNKNLELVFIGGGEKLKDLEFKIKNLDLKEQVVLTGQLPYNKMGKILLTGNVGILPLWNTPVHQARHPLKLLEYLASGLVVVTNKVGEAAKIIKDGENGILCPAGDMECLARKVEMILNNPHLAEKISQRAAVSVQSFSLKKILPRWIRFLE